MSWLLFKLFVVIASIAALTFPISQYTSFLFDNFGQAVDVIRIKKLKTTVIYLMLTCFVVGYILNVGIVMIIKVGKGV